MRSQPWATVSYMVSWTTNSAVRLLRPGPHLPDQITGADHLLDVEHRTEQLSAMLYVDPHTDPAAWQQHGALLAALDRLRVEIHAAIRPPAITWHPAPLVGRSSDTARRSRTPVRDQHHRGQGSRLRERLRRTASTQPQIQDTAENPRL